MPLILGTNSIKDTGFDVANSLRFNSDSTDFLGITQTAVTSERKKFTISCWVKRSIITSGNQTICSAGNGGGSEEFSLFFKSNDALEVYHHNGSSYEMRLITNRLFRDVSAWLNIVFVCDTANGTSALRQRLFINGVELTNANSDFSTYDESPQNDNLPVNVDERFQVGSASWGNSGNGYNLFNGYIAEFYQTAGQSNVATVFGEFDEDSPTIWKPKEPSGLSFGTNGVHLDFENSGSLGADVSGNGNNFTVNNLTSVDQSIDTCTNNFSTYNPLMVTQSATIPAFSEGNLKSTFNNAGLSLFALSTFAVSSGKWFAEFKMTNISGGSDTYVGVVETEANFAAESSPIANGTSYRGNGQRVINGSSASYGATYTTGDIIGVALNCDDNEVVFYKNGASQGAVSITADKTYFMWTSDYNSKVIEANFGSPPYSISSGNSDADGYGNFEYAVPSNHFSLNTKNLAEYG